MEKKNKKLTIIVGALLLVIGISFSYFLASILINGDGATSKAITANIKGATLNVEGTLEFNDLDILPGHQSLSAIKLTATGDNEIVPYNLIWKGTNDLNTELKFTVYKTKTNISPSVSCNKTSKVISGAKALFEECTILNGEGLGTVIGTGTINSSSTETKVTLVSDEIITATESGAVVYYYVILEYPNLDREQNEDMGKGFDGEVTVEESNTSADINIVAVYKETDSGDVEIEDIPLKSEGYVLNTTKSSCTNNATPIWNNDDWSLEVDSLSQSGTDCNLYFKIDNSMTISQLVTSLNPTAGATSFTGIADTDEGLKSGTDYVGTTYYFRGNVTNNWLKFAGFYWRIIRINGDGTIRMIYNGTTTDQTGEGTQLGTKAFNTSSNRAEYVGLQYTLAEQYGTGTNSTILGESTSTDATTLYGWYNTKIKGTSYEKYIDTEAVFCSDRDAASGHSNYPGTKGIGAVATLFKPVDRLRTTNGSSWKTTQEPVMTCSTNNQLRLPVGLITSDEVVYAGGFGGKENTSYYLYNNKSYWTMSPYNFENGYAYVFIVSTSGNPRYEYIVSNTTYGVRPVINLRSDVKLTGNGTADSPYEVA